MKKLIYGLIGSVVFSFFVLINNVSAESLNNLTEVVFQNNKFKTSNIINNNIRDEFKFKFSENTQIKYTIKNKSDMNSLYFIDENIGAGKTIVKNYSYTASVSYPKTITSAASYSTYYSSSTEPCNSSKHCEIPYEIEIEIFPQSHKGNNEPKNDSSSTAEEIKFEENEYNKKEVISHKSDVDYFKIKLTEDTQIRYTITNKSNENSLYFKDENIGAGETVEKNYTYTASARYPTTITDSAVYSTYYSSSTEPCNGSKYCEIPYEITIQRSNNGKFPEIKKHSLSVPKDEVLPEPAPIPQGTSVNTKSTIPTNCSVKKNEDGKFLMNKVSLILYDSSSKNKGFLDYKTEGEWFENIALSDNYDYSLDVGKCDSIKQANQAIKLFKENSGISINSFYIIDHGTPGKQNLGKTAISSFLFYDSDFYPLLNEVDKENGEIVFLGCRVAKGEKGEKFLQLISNSIGVTVYGYAGYNVSVLYSDPITFFETRFEPDPKYVAPKSFNETLDEYFEKFDAAEKEINKELDKFKRIKQSEEAIKKNKTSKKSSKKRRIIKKKKKISYGDKKRIQRKRRKTGGYNSRYKKMYHGKRKLRGIKLSEFTILNKNYGKTDKKAFYKNIRIKRPDISTFEPLGNYYAKDANKVYYKNLHIRKADPKTFEVFRGSRAKDKNAKYNKSRRTLKKR